MRNGNVRDTGTAGPLHPECPRPPVGTPPRRGILRAPARGPLRRSASVLALGGVLGGLLPALPAPAVEFGDGGFQGSLDTTISHGLSFRVQERDSALAAGINGNDGNLNYDRGLISNTSKFTTDLDIDAGDFGAFVRATGFIDFENQNGERERTPLSDEAKDEVGRDLELLDAYVTASLEPGETALDLRLGKHVLNWGESTFIPNGINAINHFDVTKLRQPGSELREALLPVGLASLSVAATDALSVEGFYQLDWEETEIDPVGSYFSTTDYVGAGAREAVVTLSEMSSDEGQGFGSLTPFINCDLGAIARLPTALGGSPCPAAQVAPQSAQSVFDPDFGSVLRGPDRIPDDSGQWGLALRWLAEDLNDTELGFYFVNYHSRLPIVSAMGGTQAGLQAGLGAAGAVGAPTSATIGAVTQAVTTQVQNGVRAGLIDPAAAPATIMTQVNERVRGLASALAIDRYGKTGEFFHEYPEDIQLFGLSFNTLLGASGWALQGEYSLRRDAPLQRAERSVLAEGFAPITDALELAACARDPATAGCPRAPDGSVLPPTTFGQQLQAHVASQTTRDYVQGYVERDVSQVQATATRVFGPTVGADRLVFLTEVALMHVHGMPDKTVQPLESPAGGVLTDQETDADATSWGYRVAARLDYNNAVGPVNLYPYTQFLHDVSGNSPAPSGPFVDGRTALTVGVGADYLRRWQADLGYTRYAGDANELSDRDFISVSLKYSF